MPGLGSRPLFPYAGCVNGKACSGQQIYGYGPWRFPKWRGDDEGQLGRHRAPNLVAVGRVCRESISPGGQPGVGGLCHAVCGSFNPFLVVRFQVVAVVRVLGIDKIQPGELYRDKIFIVAELDFPSAVD